uniref:Zinc finger protein ZAT10 n=1 Tax=Rhizophora mucronata TaxID=61149 RepID=A0A2P2N6V9_RHIMU
MGPTVGGSGEGCGRGR